MCTVVLSSLLLAADVTSHDAMSATHAALSPQAPLINFASRFRGCKCRFSPQIGCWNLSSVLFDVRLA